MTQNNVLMIMHVREIPECMEAFRSLRIPKVWFTGYTEDELESVIPEFIRNSDYDNYLYAADDLVPTQKALDVVEAGLERYSAFTGYCNMKPDNYRVNLRLKKMFGNQFFFVVTHHFKLLYWMTELVRLNSFPWIEEVEAIEGDFRTWFYGHCLTGLKRDLALEFMFKTYHAWGGRSKGGFGSDYVLSRQMMLAGVPMYSNREAFVYHMFSKRYWIRGLVSPHVIYELEVPAR